MRKVIISILCLLFYVSSSAQQIPLSSQYMMNRLVINPAYAGELGFNSVSLSYRKQWVNIEGAPTTQNISFHGPIMKGKLGMGLVLLRDVIGLSHENNISASFAYKIKTKKKESLSFGIGASAVFTNTNWNQAVTTHSNDKVLSDYSPSYILPDFSAGVYYNGKNSFVGVSVPMFIQHQVKGSSSGYSIVNNFSEYNYLLEAGVNLKLNKVIIKPSILSRYIPSSSFQMDINCILDFNNKLGLGFSYRTQDAVAIMLQFHLNYQLIIGYSYDYTISELEQYNNGSHELFLRYDLRYKLESIDPRFY